MNTILAEIQKIAFGLLGLICILLIFVALFRLAAWLDLRLAYGLGLAFWVAVTIAWAEQQARS